MKNFPFLGKLIATCGVSWICSTEVAQGVAMKDGVTVRVYDFAQPLTQFPMLVSGQTANYYKDHAVIDFGGPWTTSYPAPDDLISNYFYGTVVGNLKVTTGGTYELRVTSDDGAKLFINNTLIVDNDFPGENSTVATLSMLPGAYPFSLQFYQNTAASSLRLEWKPPGSSSFVVIPTTSMETEDGQIFVTSPGPKNFYYENGSGGAAGGPGDGRPLAGVHPSYDLGNFRPLTFEPRIGGVDFLPDGRMVICTWDAVGAVYILGNVGGPGEATVSRFAEGLGEPLGIKVVNGSIYVAQKQEVTKLTDTDGDGSADVYEAIAHGWPASFNYHEFTMNLLHKDGYFWCTTSTPLKTGDVMYNQGSEPGYPVPNGPGSLLRISEADRSWEITATGLRTPNGLGIGMDGEFFVGENQGGWVPTSKLNHLSSGAFFGVPQSPTGHTPYKAPALWLPHGEISLSPSQPIMVQSGSYAGQMLLGEITRGGINRVFMEKIAGEYQGVVFQFSQGMEAGINRLAWGPDGALYAGGIGAGGNWAWENKYFGLQKLTPNGITTFEMKSVQSRADGFELEFTQAVPVGIAENIANYAIQQWYYTPTISYGGGKQGTETLTVSQAQISTDRKKIFLRIPGLQAGRVVYLRIKNFVNDTNIAPWATEAWYTLNNISPNAGPSFNTLPPPKPSIAVTSTDTYEAELATYGSGPAFSKNFAGFTGTGYLDFGISKNQYVHWSVNAWHAGAHTVTFRYALGGSGKSRPMDISVNGVRRITGLKFTSSIAWTDYRTVDVTLNLNKGSNTIRATATTSEGANLDNLTVTGPARPPAGATVLFDGTNTSAWVRGADGTPANWPIINGYMEVRHLPAPDDIVTSQTYKDFRMHADWWSPSGGTGQEAGNSGIKLQRRYEVQVLGTGAGIPMSSLTNQDAGSIYTVRKPDLNMSTGPGTWQSYDIWFTAARWSGSKKVTNARMTVYWNGTLVHNDVEVANKTGASIAEGPVADGILLQDHSTNAVGEVRFRAIWVQPATSFAERRTSWSSSFGLTGTNAAGLADPDSDGMVNIWEYASGSSPTNSALQSGGKSLVPQMQTIKEGTNSFIQFKYRRRIDYVERGLYFTVETSPSLESWTQQPATEVGTAVPTGDGVTEVCTIRLNNPVPVSTTNLFARVTAEILD